MKKKIYQNYLFFFQHTYYRPPQGFAAKGKKGRKTRSNLSNASDWTKALHARRKKPTIGQSLLPAQNLEVV